MHVGVLHPDPEAQRGQAAQEKVQLLPDVIMNKHLLKDIILCCK